MDFKEVGMPIKWEGAGKDEKGIHAETGKTIVEIDHRYLRPTEVDHLVGDASKAMKQLGWKPRYTLEEMVKELTHGGDRLRAIRRLMERLEQTTSTDEPTIVPQDFADLWTAFRTVLAEQEQPDA